MFNRLFGKKKKKEEEPPPPDMEEVSGRMDSRMSTLQQKVCIDCIGETLLANCNIYAILCAIGKSV